MRIVPTLLLLGLAACGEERAAPKLPAEEPLVAFDTTTLRIASGADTAVLRAEVAMTDEQRAMGLMERTRLPQDAGMLFWYPETQPEHGAFWMFRTRIPLDIAFVDSAGTIRAIHGMEPCESPDPRWCPSYPAGVPFRGAVEANRGWFAQQGIELGDRVLLEEVGGLAGAGPP